MEHDFYCENILNGKIQVNIELETESVLAFRHTNPSWSFHIVVVPKIHTRDLATVENLDLIKDIFEVITELVKKYKLQNSNFKIVSNGGDFQDSKHLHFHLLHGHPLPK